MIIFVGIAAFISTFLGGLFAIKFKDKLHLILGFSAGAVISVAFFDLLPEALELGKGHYETSTITSITALGFVCYMILDRFFFFHSHGAEHECGKDHSSEHKGILGAGSFSIHSFIDGVAIGLAFQVSWIIGGVVAIAVLVHDFSDGINTVNMILKNSGSKSQAMRWLFLDSTAPMLGVISTLFFSVSKSTLGVILALFCGFFLYIGASDLLPESHHNHPTYLTTIFTVLGVIVLYTAIKLAGI
jgi:ZIP family zinc transporter